MRRDHWKRSFFPPMLPSGLSMCLNHLFIKQLTGTCRGLRILVLVGSGQLGWWGVPVEGQEPPGAVRPPFTTMPDRLPGPPRAMGELPAGRDLPPSTLPGRAPGQPPRSMGEAPPPLGDFGPTAPLPRFGDPNRLTPAPLRVDPRGVSPGLDVPSVDPFDAARPGGSLFDFQNRLNKPIELDDDTRIPITDQIPRRTRRQEEQPTEPPIELRDVYLSALQAYPPFQAILLERDIAEGGVLSAIGAFDTRLNADSRNYPLGYYRRSVHDIFIDQPLRDLGGKFFAGYRIAEGLHPSYYSFLNTRGGGAFVVGVELPLLRDRAIDAKRAKLIQAEIERTKADPTILKDRLTLAKMTGKAYWEWYASARALKVLRLLLELVEERGEAIETRIREGLDRPGIDLLEFRRLLLARRIQVVAAERRFQLANIELSLLLRDPRGFPVIPRFQQVPGALTAEILPPNDERLPRDLNLALQFRPEAVAFRLNAAKADVEATLARNQLLPALNFYVYTEQNIGDRNRQLEPDFRPFIAETSLLFDVPLQRREARGRIISADAQVRQSLLDARFAEERIQADVIQAYATLQALYRQLQDARENERANLDLERAEIQAFNAGFSNILFLNIREQATLDARISRIEAEGRYQSAYIDYLAALGLDILTAPSELLEATPPPQELNLGDNPPAGPRSAPAAADQPDPVDPDALQPPGDDEIPQPLLNPDQP